MKKVTAILIGAGQRGSDAYGPYALEHPDEIQFIAVAEPDADRRKAFAKAHSISDDMCFENWEDILARPRFADAALICTQDRLHFKPALKALEQKYHVMLEKPMAIDARDCIVLGEYAKKYDRIFSICHILRYAKFFSTIKELLQQGRIGRLISIQHNENVGFWHQAHSYVRGNWRNSETSSPMILAKSCHDLDIILWLADAECVNLSSFGSLTHFKSENAPAGAPLRCTDGCPASDSCKYYAPNTYLTENTDWPTSVISSDMSFESRERALKEGPYGRCVYHCDNNVVDHQVVNMEFSNEVTAAFTMCAFTLGNKRTLKLMGTEGEIRGDMDKSEIEVIDFKKCDVDIVKYSDVNGSNGHGGGDRGIMEDFVRLVGSNGEIKSRTSADVSVMSHIMAFAAEKSRLEKRVINIKEYMAELK